MQSSENKLPLKEKLGYSCLGFSLCAPYQLKGLYYMFFITNVLFLSPKLAGYIIAIGTVWDAINDPMIGIFAANRKFKNGERLRPYAWKFVLPFTVAFICMFTKFNVSPTGSAIISIISALLFSAFFTFMCLTCSGMALVTEDPDERVVLNSYYNTGSAIGNAVASIAILPLLAMAGALDSDGNLVDGSKFVYIAILLGAVCILGAFVFYKTTREHVVPVSDRQAEKKTVSFRQGIKILNTWSLRNKNTIYYLLLQVSITMVVTTVTYYCTYVLNSLSTYTGVITCYTLAGIFSTFTAKYVMKALGRHGCMILNALLASMGKIGILIAPQSMVAVYIAMITSGYVSQFAIIVNTANTCDNAELIEWHRGVRLDSFIGSVDTLIAKLALSFSSIILTQCLAHANFDATLPVQPEGVTHVILFMMGWLSVIVGVLALIVVFKYPIDEKMKEMRAEKAAKAAETFV